MDKSKQVDTLREALFKCLIDQLQQDPTSAWARVARDVLADYDNNAEDSFGSETKAALQKLQESGPFKMGSG